MLSGFELYPRWVPLTWGSILGRWQPRKSQSKRTQNDVGFFLSILLSLSRSDLDRKRVCRNLRANAARRFTTLTCLHSVRLFSLYLIHQLTNKDYFKVSQARYTYNAYFGQTNKSIWGSGQRNDCSYRHWLKIHPTPVKPPRRLVIFAPTFSIYLIFYNAKSCRESPKQFVQLPIAYIINKNIYIFMGSFRILIAGIVVFRKVRSLQT